MTFALFQNHAAVRIGMTILALLFAMTGSLAWSSPNDCDDFACHLEAAKSGDAEAQFKVALAYLYARGVEEDLKKAEHWFHESAENGLAAAQYNYALMYDSGYGVEKDPVKARLWYGKAADQGDLDALTSLGDLMVKGIGGKVDHAQARTLFELAAELGNPQAQFNLAGMHLQGLAGLGDPKEACRLYNASANGGHSEAKLIYQGMVDRGLCGGAKPPPVRRSLSGTWKLSLQLNLQSSIAESKGCPESFYSGFPETIDDLIEIAESGDGVVIRSKTLPSFSLVKYVGPKYLQAKESSVKQQPNGTMGFERELLIDGSSSDDFVVAGYFIAEVASLFRERREWQFNRMTDVFEEVSSYDDTGYVCRLSYIGFALPLG